MFYIARLVGLSFVLQTVAFAALGYIIPWLLLNQVDQETYDINVLCTTAKAKWSHLIVVTCVYDFIGRRYK